MKKTLICCLLMSLFASARGQVLLAKWTFPTGTSADSVPDGGIAANLDKAIHTFGGTSAIDFSKNGYTTKAATATMWDNGMDTKYWQVQVSTLGYEGITLSSRQQSGGANPGPRDWKVQYKVGAGGAWTDVAGAAVTVLNDWTTGHVDSIPLPGDCDDQPLVSIRWIMTSNTNSTGAAVTSNGIDKIDEIYFYGLEEPNGLPEQYGGIAANVYPNPVSGKLFVTGAEGVKRADLIDLTGKILLATAPGSENFDLDLSGVKKGLYLLRLTSAAGKMSSKIIVVQ